MKHDAGQLLLPQRSRRGERIRHVTHQCGAESTKLANGFVDCGCDLRAMAGRVIFQFDDGAYPLAEVRGFGNTSPHPGELQVGMRVHQPRQHGDVAKIDFIRRGEVAGT